VPASGTESALKVVAGSPKFQRSTFLPRTEQPTNISLNILSRESSSKLCTFTTKNYVNGVPSVKILWHSFNQSHLLEGTKLIIFVIPSELKKKDIKVFKESRRKLKS
jgi:hypothetical protein